MDTRAASRGLGMRQRQILLRSALGTEHVPTAAGKIPFRLEGRNEGWQYIGNRHRAFHNNMPPAAFDSLFMRSACTHL